MEKYDIAISTSCGRLDDIVVDTIDTAQACVQYLRTNNLGRYISIIVGPETCRATFIILEKIQHLRKYADAPFTAPANSERLYDLIKVQKPDVKIAFYFALKDTLVTQGLERASRYVHCIGAC